ncbi:MAG TPA: cohesin domain-containing protein [Terriglobales bacterium]|nr:cohesin domain-containing protein [Terriglobales bacterium]
MIRRLRLPALLAVLLLMAVPAAADQAKKLYNQGRDAEAREDYLAAFELYKQAFDLKPRELKYRVALQRSRYRASAVVVKRGQDLRDQGKLDEAMAEFMRALSIDPSSAVARQEIERTRALKPKAGGEATGPPPEDVLRRRVEQAGGPVELAPIANVPITLRLTEDTKVIYQTIGKLAGINVLFDPDYVSRRIPVELNGVTLEEALEILALQSKTFWRPVTPNTIFVAADTTAKRKELEQNLVRTFYMSNLSQPSEYQDIVNTMRTILEVSRITPLPTQGAIVVRGTPDQVALAEKLIADIDRAKPEVIVEVAVMQVSRDKLRNLGIQPPTSTTLQLQGTTTQTTTGGTTGTTTTPNTITLNQLSNLDASDFLVTIPAATANFLFTDSATKLVQNPIIRALDGQKASLKIGDRVPVATGSFQPGIGGVGINPLVNTQFQYIDVGVNIDITPKVHSGREVTLKVMLDISAVTSRVNIGGIDQPVIGQRKVEHDIRMREGEVNLLGGILEEQDVKSLSGIPGLAQIPFLRYFFSSENVQHRENELIFALIPRIVRVPQISELNVRPLAVGTGTGIDLRRAAASTVPNAMAPTGGGAAPVEAVPTTPAPQPVPEPAKPTAGAGARLGFDPASATVATGATFTLNVVLSGGQSVYSVPLQIAYEAGALQLLNVSNGGYLSQDGQAVALVHRDDPLGTLQISASRPPGAAGVSGDGSVFTLTFLAKTAGEATVTISRPGARDASMQAIPVTATSATITIR